MLRRGEHIDSEVYVYNYMYGTEKHSVSAIVTSREKERFLTQHQDAVRINNNLLSDIIYKYSISKDKDEYKYTEKELELVNEVAEMLHIEGLAEDLRTRDRGRDYVVPRMMVAYVLKNAMNYTDSKIGKLIGRNHATAYNCRSNAENEIYCKTELGKQITQLTNKYKYQDNEQLEH